MDDVLTKEWMEYIVYRILENAIDAVKYRNEQIDPKSKMYQSGRVQGYYEVLDVIKNELQIKGQNVAEFGLDFPLEEIS